MTTLKQAIEAMEIFKSIKIVKNSGKKSIVDELLGKYKGIIPEGKSSSEFIREMRNSLSTFIDIEG